MARAPVTPVAADDLGPAREPLWTRDYALTILSLHLFFLAWSMLFATLPLYLDGVPKWQVGWVVGGAFGVASFIMRPFSGRLADRRGRRPVVVFGGGLTALTLAAHGITADPTVLTAVRLLNGVGMCLYTTAAMAQLADVLPATRRGEGMGWYGVVFTLSNVYGPWLGQAVADRAGFHAFYVLAGVVTAVAAALALALTRPDRPVHDGIGPSLVPVSGKNQARRDAAIRPPLVNRAALLPTGTFLALTLAYSVLPAFLALYVRQEGFGSAGLFFFLMGVALVPARWFGGSMADRFGRAAVIFPGLALAAAGMALLAAAHGSVTLYGAALVFGVGFGLGHTGLTILTVDRAPPDQRGAAMATLSLAWDTGTIGSFLLGFVGDAIGFRALFGVAAAMPILSAGGFQIARGRGYANGDDPRRRGHEREVVPS